MVCLPWLTQCYVNRGDTERNSGKKKIHLRVKCQLLFQNFRSDSITLKDSEKLSLTNNHRMESVLLYAQRDWDGGQTDITKITFTT
jgi:hypothetical protein